MLKTILSQFYRGVANKRIVFSTYLFGKSFKPTHQLSQFQLNHKNKAYYSYVDLHQEEEEKEVTRFDQFVTNPKILSQLNAHGFQNMFPIQAECFPLVLQGKDILASDRTGSGKTLAYTLPILQKLYKENLNIARIKYPQFLILTPTRELALQVTNEINKFASQFKVVTVYGGSSMTQQIDLIKSGVGIIVATPGRFMDLMDKGVIQLKHLKAVCIDQADTMLQKGFKLDVQEIMNQVNEVAGKTQNLMFSATIPSWVASIAQRYLKNMKKINMIKDQQVRTSQTIEHYGVMLNEDERHQSVIKLIQKYNPNERTIIFTKTKNEANNFIKYFNDEDIVILHGDITQSSRQNNLNQFRNGKKKILIATDVAARGLDIPNVQLIIQLSPPEHPQPFIHRAGRTGRAGKQGINITVFDRSTIDDLIKIEKIAKINIKVLQSLSSIEEMNKKSNKLLQSLAQYQCNQKLSSFFQPYIEKILEKTTPQKALLYFLQQKLGNSFNTKSKITDKQGYITYRAYKAKSNVEPLPKVLQKVKILNVVQREDYIRFDIDWYNFYMFEEIVQKQNSYQIQLDQTNNKNSLEHHKSKLYKNSKNSSFFQSISKPLNSRIKQSSQQSNFINFSRKSQRKRAQSERNLKLGNQLFINKIPEGINAVTLEQQIKKQFKIKNFNLRIRSKTRQNGSEYRFGFINLQNIEDSRPLLSKMFVLNDEDIEFRLMTSK